ncbi:hypothetical protein XELAEV_18015635mg [Xenopus laevis]|uniref:Uncharacterized protein n=1 Tax=Xenopus laevis TaxID=8355 RepID=A0A974DIE6_XENLA|nr:hypothetical protein XELAEV_18015635mg [Xenopus laevis]
MHDKTSKNAFPLSKLWISATNTHSGDPKISQGKCVFRRFDTDGSADIVQLLMGLIGDKLYICICGEKKKKNRRVTTISSSKEWCRERVEWREKGV